MANINLDLVKSYVTQHGRVVHYFRPHKGAKCIRLPGLPGSEEFMARYAELLGTAAAAPVKIEPGSTRTKPGTVAALIARHIASGAFQIARGSTQAQYMRILNMLRD